MRHTVMFCGAAALIAGWASAVPSAIAAPHPEISEIVKTCVATGLDPSEAPFAYCVAALRAEANPTAEPDANTSKAQRACAALGYDPAAAQYSSCVGNLEQTLVDQARVQS
jgi:hypothetical protein